MCSSDLKKVVDKKQQMCYYNLAVAKSDKKQEEKEINLKFLRNKKIKKVLTNKRQNDIMSKLSQANEH